ncbi:MAG: ASKHA domain-containing protein, partial [Phycisphaerae bacterium]|nr:ASKHA domain-containing protein [Phycisphaerae bacterium]
AFVIENDIEMTQQDIRQIQLAVGAIRAGINIMLKKAGIKAANLKKILIAGGFGSFIRRNHAQRIGLLPADIDHQIISFIGNSSLAGAKLALLSVNARQKAEKFAAKAQHIELSADSDFQNEFASAMIFPAG